MCEELGITVIAEGIETRAERDFFAAHGITLMQGYLFAKPAFKDIPTLNEGSLGSSHALGGIARAAGECRSRS
jgi:EAL domain-containing protein (putative c-di-GMP-specific phosphodiesterase class I)